MATGEIAYLDRNCVVAEILAQFWCQVKGLTLLCATSYLRPFSLSLEHIAGMFSTGFSTGLWECVKGDGNVRACG